MLSWLLASVFSVLVILLVVGLWWVVISCCVGACGLCCFFGGRLFLVSLLIGWLVLWLYLCWELLFIA